jgi:RNA polymerase sigma factor (sigma-70 family)
VYDTLVDAGLVVAAQRGDRAAMEELVAVHLPLVYSLVGRALRGHADVDDVVQETMLRLVNGLHTLREPERFRSWLVTIAMRQIQERARSRSTATAPLEPAEEFPDSGANFADLAVERLHLSGQRKEVNEATRWLSGSDREVLSLWWLEAAGELSRAELASALMVSVPHAGVRIQRMKAQLSIARSTVRALSAPAPCPELARVAEGFDGQPSTLWLKRFGRHVRGCRTCDRFGSAMVPAERLLAGAALLPVPLGLGLLAKAATVPATKAATTAAATAGPIARLLQILAAKPAVTATIAAVVVAGGAGVGIIDLNRPAEPVARGPVTASVAPTAAASPTAAAAPSPTAAPAAPAVGVTRADYYLSPGGDDNAAGTLAHPFGSLTKVASVVKPGQTIAVRGGVYKPTTETKITSDGTATKRILLAAYGTEKPVFDGSDLPDGTWLIRMTAGYWSVTGIEIRNVPGKPIACYACRYDTFDRLTIHDNQDTGLSLLDPKTTGNQILDSDFYHNHDDGTKGRNADGIGIKLGSGSGNVVKNCRLWENSDDGLDLWGFTGAVTVTGTWAWGNGVNRWSIKDFDGDGAGFRLGGNGASAAHSVTHDAAWDNAAVGFTGVDNDGTPVLTNVTAYHNGRTGFTFKDGSATLSHVVSASNGDTVSLGSSVSTSDSSLDVSVGFSSTSSASAQGARKADGSLPATPFLVTGGGIGASMREQ